MDAHPHRSRHGAPGLEDGPLLAGRSAQPMLVNVALVPGEARRWGQKLCVVVDVLRASSMIVTLLDRGCRAVVPAGSLAEARRLARQDGSLLAGEHNVVRPPGFDFGNSPSEIAGEEFSGQTAVLSTRNGTAVLRSLRNAPTVVIGCLLNATACGRYAFTQARRSGMSIGIVCAGRDGSFALDDAVAAGLLVESIVTAGALESGECVLSDAARAARSLWSGSPDLLAALRESTGGRMLAAHGLDEDAVVCARADTSSVVPLLVGTAPPRLEQATA